MPAPRKQRHNAADMLELQIANSRRLGTPSPPSLRGVTLGVLKLGTERVAEFPFLVIYQQDSEL